MIRWVPFLASLLLLSACASKRGRQHNLSHQEKQLLEKYSELTAGKVEKKDVALYQFIDRWWGVPHKIGGLDSTGIDCSGFMFRLFDEVYDKKVARTTDGLQKQSVGCDTADLVTGDLVFIVFQGRQKVSHVGVYLQNGRFVHASTSKGVRIDYMRDNYYRKQQFIGGKLP